tara:strand:+ start:15608 stop:16135 length:528 start_codon:yes stop_codon:yes gene_type:complete
MAKPDGIVSIHGKDYQTVAYRLGLFRADYPKGSIITELISDVEGVIVFKATIMDGDICLATGYAEEVRGSSNIHKTSALEIAETSAVGRGLAFAKYHGTASIASADEVSVAIARQDNPEPKATKKQVEAITNFLGDQEDGAELSQKILKRAGVDHIKELNKRQALACIKQWSIDG